MPILLPESSISDDRLVEMLRDHRAVIEGLLPRVEDPGVTVRSPLGLFTATELGRDALTLVALAEESGASRGLRVAVVNLAYDVMVAMVDLLKSHTDLPKVPGGRPATR